jgi:predicted O-methyltransferase YrrM
MRADTRMRVPSLDVTDPDDCPALVERAYAAARQIGFPLTRADPGHGRGSACLPGVGRFLAVLAAGCHGGRIAEFGTGAGIGAAWMSDAMPSDCTLVTAEIDPVRAAAAAGVLAGDNRVRVLTGDALELLAPHGPYDLIFADCGVRGASMFGAVVSLLRPGGRIVSDDLTPQRALAAGSPLAERDPKREMFAGDDRLICTEVVLPDLANSLLVGTRR